MRAIAVSTALTLMLVAAGPAAAKEVMAAKVCGADDCRVSRDSEELTTLAHGGAAASPPERGRPWYRMILVFRGEGSDRFRMPLAIVPGERLVRWEDEYGTYSWSMVPPATLELARRLTAGLEPRPAASLDLGAKAPPAEARVDEVVVIDPPAEPADPSSGGDVPTSVAAAGGAVLLGASALLIGLRLRRRSPGSPPKPAS